VVSPTTWPVTATRFVVLGTAGVVVRGAAVGNKPSARLIWQPGPFLVRWTGFDRKRNAVLSWFTISDAQNVAGIAELGIVFLLFLIGLELSCHGWRRCAVW